jgi:hypothetical protein
VNWQFFDEPEGVDKGQAPPGSGKSSQLHLLQRSPLTRNERRCGFLLLVVVFEVLCSIIPFVLHPPLPATTVMMMMDDDQKDIPPWVMSEISDFCFGAATLQ